MQAALPGLIAEPADQPWGERLASVADPDGDMVHIASTDTAGGPG
jgi:lactoylglutathione lyase